MKQNTKSNSKYISSILLGSVLLGSFGHAAVVFEPRQEQSTEVQSRNERVLRRLYMAGMSNYRRHLKMDESAIREEFRSNSREAFSKNKLGKSVSELEFAQTQSRFEDSLDRSNKEELLEKELKVLRVVYSHLPEAKNAKVTITSVGDITGDWLNGLPNIDPNPLAALLWLGVLPFAILGDVIAGVIYILSFGQYGV